MASELELIVWLTSSGLLGWIGFGLPTPQLSRAAAGREAGSAPLQVGPQTRASKPRAVEAAPLVLDGDVAALARASDAALPLVLSREVVADLARQPHLLVAGASGSGKSVALHAMLQGMLAVDRADLWLVDPKMVEAAPYSDHARVVFADGAQELLAEAVETMEARYRLMLARRERDWPGRSLVIVIDEYGDLILGTDRATSKAVERSIVLLAQKGRAAGVHLILATQRPSADVVTPLIRANIPGRLALRCASAADSRIIRGDGAAYERLTDEPVGSALWGTEVVRAPFVDPYTTH